MANRYPLDTRFAIADAFDARILRGECSVNQIADAVGANRKSVGRTLVHMGFACTRKACVLTEPIPPRYAPPRSLPRLARPSPITQGIIDLYDSGRWSGRCYARDIAALLGVTEDKVGRGLKRLKFTVVKRAHSKFVRMEPAVWASPTEWPELLQKQRDLKRSGLSTGQVMRATDLSAEITAIIDAAVKLLDVQDVALFKRGALKEKIKEVIQEVYTKAVRDSIARDELARWLREDPGANRAYLQSRVEGYVRFASKRLCQHCGRNPARL